MSRSFTWFEKFGDVMAALPSDEARDEFAVAIVRYGAFGEEPKFTNPILVPVFIAVREDVDNSLNKRASKNKGGRPSKGNAQVKTGSDDSETSGSAKPETSGFESSETSGFDNRETSCFAGSETSGSAKVETQYNPIQSNTIQANTCDGARRATRDERDASTGWPFVPPTYAEAEAYFGANCLKGDPRAFVDYYEGQGWLKSNGRRVTSWQAVAKTWSRNQPLHDARDRRERTAAETAGEFAGIQAEAWEPLGVVADG